MGLGIALVIILVIFILLIIASCIKIVPQAQALIIERLGAYMGTWGVGIHFKRPGGKACDLKGAGSGLCTAAGNYKG